jgi:cation:H+ antiporter
MLTLLAVFFFTGTLWVLGKDGTLDVSDGLVMLDLRFDFEFLE